MYYINPHSNPRKSYHYYRHLDEDTEAQRGSKVIETVNNWAKFIT